MISPASFVGASDSDAGVTVPDNFTMGVNKPDYWLIGASESVPVPTTRFAPYFEGTSQYLSPAVRTLPNSDWYIEFEIQTSQVNADWAVADTNSFNDPGENALIYVDNPDGLEILYPKATSGFNRYIFGGQSLICDGNRNTVRLERVGSSLEASVNGSVFSTVPNIDETTISLSDRWFGGYRFLDGIVLRLDINGTVFPLTESFDDYPILQSSNTSETIEAKNFSSSNVVETST